MECLFQCIRLDLYFLKKEEKIWDRAGMIHSQLSPLSDTGQKAYWHLLPYKFVCCFY